MNVILFQSALGEQITANLSASELNKLTASAVRGYSRYRPLQRHFGEGALAVDAASGTGQNTALLIVGGPFKPGDVLQFDAYQPWAETLTVATVSPIPPSSQTLFVGTPVSYTFTGNLVSTHYAGATIVKLVSGQPFFGLSLLTGQSQYAMPGDFIMPEGESWGYATGERYMTKRAESFYNSVYQYSELTTGVDWGMAQNFTGGDQALGFGWVGLPGLPAGVLNVASGLQLTYSFSEGQSRILTLQPAPTSARQLDFYYWALQQPETVPDEDVDALLDLGVAWYFTSRISALAQEFDFTEADTTERPSATITALETQVNDRISKFTDKIARAPFLVQG